jgi:hypothetical protein
MEALLGFLVIFVFLWGWRWMYRRWKIVFSIFAREHPNEKRWDRFRNVDELETLRLGVCPDCLSKEFLEGPSSGLSRNVKCSNCDSEFNIGPRFVERINRG